MRLVVLAVGLSALCVAGCSGGVANGGDGEKVGRTSEKLSGCGTIVAGQELDSGDSFPSCNGAYTLVMQTDANLVLYTSGGQALWATGTNAFGAPQKHAIMQTDGNFVVYGYGIPNYATCTDGSGADHAVVQDDGNFVVYAGGTPVWASGTSGAQQGSTDPLYCQGRLY